MISIPLLGGQVATVVDDVDVDFVLARGPWSRVVTKGGRTYAHRAGLYLHRALMQAPRGLDVDHVNSDGLDNQRANLRLATRSQNLANSGPRGGASRYKGVTWDKRKGRWMAQAKLNGKHHFLGYHPDEEAAAAAYNVFALSAWGAFAYQNQLLQGVV